jgi:hypothetical protein
MGLIPKPNAAVSLGVAGLKNRRVPAKVTPVGFAAISQSERLRLCQVSFIA